MRGGQGEGANSGQVRKGRLAAYWGIPLGVLWAYAVVLATEPLPKAPEAPLGAYDASACATLERKCWTTEDGKPEVRCERPAFARALLGCVDLWEAERLCAESLTSSRDLYSVDLEAWTAELGRLEQERNAMRLQGWVWLALGVVGWGAATGFLIWGMAK